MDWLIVHAAATWALVGLIWTVQLVAYPQFEAVDEQGFRAYHEAHCRRIGWIVAPLMAVEGVSGLALLLTRPAGIEPLWLWVGLGLIGVHLGLTGLLAVPLHGRLAAGQDARLIARLLAVNWARTVVWSVRGVLVATWLA